MLNTSELLGKTVSRNIPEEKSSAVTVKLSSFKSNISNKIKWKKIYCQYSHMVD